MTNVPRALDSREKERLVVGAVLQPLLAAAIAFLVFPILLLDRSGRTLAGGFPADPAEAAVSVAFGAGLVAALVTLVGVLPTAAWLTKRRRVSFGQALSFGLGFGLFPYLVIGALAGGTYGPSGLLRGVAFAGILGLSGAALFWVIALRPTK